MRWKDAAGTGGVAVVGGRETLGQSPSKMQDAPGNVVQRAQR